MIGTHKISVKRAGRSMGVSFSSTSVSNVAVLSIQVSMKMFNYDMFRVHPYILVIQPSFLHGYTVFVHLLTDGVQLTGVLENKSGRKEPVS